MGRLTHYARARIVSMRRQGLGYVHIQRRLLDEENFYVSRQAISSFWKKYEESGNLAPGHGGGREVILKDAHLNFIEEKMTANSELTAPELQTLLYEQFSVEVSEATILRCRIKLGWVYGAVRYCQQISDKNKPLRETFASSRLTAADTFDDVIFVDECIVQMGSNVRRMCHKKGAPLTSRLKAKPKHPYQVCVWAGISKRGATNIVIFEGTMDSDLYIRILREHLVPFIREKFPNGHRFWQDNCPMHTSIKSRAFYEENDINWYKTPAQSPDMNPIENVWAQLKHYVHKVVKPKLKEQHIQAIKEFWQTKVTPELCTRYINHLRKVIPAVIEQQGQATGY